MTHPSISGSTRLFAIIGDPIAQAKSPAVFNELFTDLGADAVLVPMQVSAQGLLSTLEGLKGVANLDGIVVTVPHKVSALKAAEVIGPQALRVGAVNCLRRLADGHWSGEMYDGAGFVAGLHEQGFQPAGWRVFQAGCGGAGKAVAHALAAADIASLDLFDVNESLQKALVADLRHHYPGLSINEARAPQEKHDLIVNATPCGMAPGDPLPFDLEASRPDAVVADLIMKPEHTLLLQAAATRGQRVHLGRHLLENQAKLIARYFGFDV